MGGRSSTRMHDIEEDSRSRSDNSDSSSWEYDSDSDADHNYVQMLQSLINSGQLVLQRFSEDKSYRRIPKIKYKPDTTILDKSEFAANTKLACGLGEPIKKKLKGGDNVTSLIVEREKGIKGNSNGFAYSTKCKITNKYLPNDYTTLNDTTGKVFCGIFSKDGNRFLTASQDRHIRLYNSGDGSYKMFKSLRARDVGWSIIDVAFSPDEEYFVYSTWSSALHICPVNGSSDHQEPLNLLSTGRRFCVFSVVFSSDGRELLGGANDGHIYIYDRERNCRSSKIAAHGESDVNSVSFADDSSHIIYSGGDDALIKVWDRRMLDERSAKPVGILGGHMDGITFIDSRGDGRHLISNSKDQSIKLWDVRAFSREDSLKKSLKVMEESTVWDYRWQNVPSKRYASKSKLESDTSLMTYRGHVVIKTLIRCRFSPAESTGQRYIYTGCGHGHVVVYDALTGKIVRRHRGHYACVRDVSWHPTMNEILSSSWDGQVGRWKYYENTNFDDYKLEEQKSGKNQSEEGTSKPTRRSVRLAQKRGRRAFC